MREVRGVEAEGLAHRQRAERPALLQDDAELRAPVGTGGGRVLSEHEHVAAVTLAVALEDLGRRGLACSVTPEEREYLAALHLEVQAIDDVAVAVALE